MTTGVIVQARMTSKRFPGKVLMPLAGQTVLSRVIERCLLIPFVDTVICAFPADDASIPIYQACNDMGVACASGPEDDVLRRYYDAATMYGIDTIIRVTADCPFLDPLVAGEVLALLKAENLDYCSNVFPKRTYAKGLDVEAFTYDCLEAAHLMSKAPAYREHVTPWMQKRVGVRRANVMQRINRSGLNWCIDFPEDIRRLEKLLLVANARHGIDADTSVPTVISAFNKTLMEQAAHAVKH